MVDRAPNRFSWILLVSLGLPGCSDPPDSPSIVPDPATGHRAIEALMATWKAGHPTGIVEPTSPRVQVVDNHRKAGQTLVGFEILAESADSRFRTFSVRLNLDNPEEHPVARYLVVGIDPILIFLQEDYELLMHWEHRMEPEAPKAGEPPAPASQ
jgi:hypothetical protein